MEVMRGTPVLYKGKPNMYLGKSKFIKNKHLVARKDKDVVVLTAVHTNDISVTAPIFFDITLTPEQETKLARF